MNEEGQWCHTAIILLSYPHIITPCSPIALSGPVDAWLNQGDSPNRWGVQQGRDRIIQYWQMLYREAPTRFRTELGQRLLGSDLPPGNWESAAFAALSEVVETVACQRGIERWSISSQ